MMVEWAPRLKAPPPLLDSASGNVSLAERTVIGYAVITPSFLPTSDDASRMTFAFTFPGQGSQTVGMGQSLAQGFTVSRHVFQEIDEALGDHLSRIMWEGPERR